MVLEDIINQKKITKYKLSKESGVPYTTINDICSGKTQLEKSTSETVYKLAQALGMSMEELIEPCIEKRIGFDLYKSNICHKLKEMGDIDFIIEVLEKDDISKLYKKAWHREALYLLAMLDYVSRVNEIPICTKYDKIRKCKLKEPIYPSSVVAASMVDKESSIKKQSMDSAIPEFKRFNIIENEVRDVV